MNTIETLTAAIMASDLTAHEEATRAYVIKYVEMHGIDEAAKRIIGRAETAKNARKPRNSAKPPMIRDNYKGRTFYRRADASEIHDM